MRFFEGEKVRCIPGYDNSSYGNPSYGGAGYILNKILIVRKDVIVDSSNTAVFFKNNDSGGVFHFALEKIKGPYEIF